MRTGRHAMEHSGGQQHSGHTGVTDAHERSGTVARIFRDPVVLLTIGLVVARLVYLWVLCPYELVEDEAHYWEWSRRLGLSYYTKGPGVAWSIAASTWLFGAGEAAVRMPAVIASAISTLGIGALSRAVFQSSRAGFYAAALFNLTPVFQFTSLLITIDSPYIACWTMACWAGWRAAQPRDDGSRSPRRLGWWALLGASLGIGFLYKYTILLAVPGIMAGSWLARRRHERTPSTNTQTVLGIVVMACVWTLCASPVIIWNWQEGWPTVRHLIGHLGLSGGDVAVKPAGTGWSYQPRWTFELIGVQAVLLGAVTMSLVGSIAWARRQPVGAADRRGAAYLIACSIPILVFYVGVTFVNRAEGNWPVAGFVTLIALAGGWMARELHKPDAPAKSFCRSSWDAGLWAGVIVGVLMLRVDLLAQIPGIGPLVPVGRLIGARDQARHVEELTASLRDQTGLDPLIIVQHYGQASRLAFYLTGRPVVYCSSSFMGGRMTQYDYWTDTDLTDPALIGRPGVLIGAVEEQWQGVFAAVEPIGQIRGETKRDRQSFLGTGFKGYKRPGSPATRTSEAK